MRTLEQAFAGDVGPLLQELDQAASHERNYRNTVEPQWSGDTRPKAPADSLVSELHSYYVMLAALLTEEYLDSRAAGEPAGPHPDHHPELEAVRVAYETVNNQSKEKSQYV